MSKRRHLSLTITPWSTGIRPSWTVEAVRTALQQHRLGMFEQSSLLAESMNEDDEFPSALEKRVGAVVESYFELRTPEHVQNKQRAERIRKQLAPLWETMVCPETVDELSRSCIMSGVGLGWLEWDLGRSFWLPRLHALPTQFLRYDDNERRWWYHAREGELEVTPGDGKWVLLLDGPRGWLRGAVRGLAVAWVAKQWAVRDWNRYNERHGLPILKALVPSVAEDSDKEDFIEDVKSLGAEAVAGLPTHLDDQGAAFDLQLLEAVDKSWESFERLVQYCNRRFQIYMQGSHLATELTEAAGSRAAAETHRGVAKEKAAADAAKRSKRLREQVLQHVVALNFGGDDPSVTPVPYWDVEPPEDLIQRGVAQRTFGEALTSLRGAGYEVRNVEVLATEYGLELGRRSQDPAPEPEPPPAGSGRPVEAKLSSGDDAPGALRGQLYTDRVTEGAIGRAEWILDEDRALLLGAIGRATSFDGLRRDLLKLYRDRMTPASLDDLLQRAMVMAQLAGVGAVSQDGEA